MSPGFVAFLVLVMGGVVFGSWYYSRDVRTRRKLASTPPTAIADAASGAKVRLTGEVQRHEEELTAPLTGRRCVYYLAIVEEYRSSGKSGRWVEILRDEQHVDFVLRDVTGTALVCMDMPQVAVVRDHHTRSGTFDDANEAEAALLEQFAKKSTNFLGLNRSLRYSEGALEFGEEITVFGLARPGDNDVCLTLETPEDARMLLTDHPRTVQALPRRRA